MTLSRNKIILMVCSITLFFAQSRRMMNSAEIQLELQNIAFFFLYLGKENQKFIFELVSIGFSCSLKYFK